MPATTAPPPALQRATEAAEARLDTVEDRVRRAAHAEARAHSMRLSKAEIARRCDTSRVYLSAVMNGREVASEEFVARLEAVVEAEAQRLAAEEDQAPTPALDDGTEDDDLL